MRRNASAAPAVRKVISAQGRPPSVSALASGAAADGSSITMTGTILSRASLSASRELPSVMRSCEGSGACGLHPDLDTTRGGAVSTLGREKRLEDGVDPTAADSCQIIHDERDESRNVRQI